MKNFFPSLDLITATQFQVINGFTRLLIFPGVQKKIFSLIAFWNPDITFSLLKPSFLINSYFYCFHKNSIFHIWGIPTYKVNTKICPPLCLVSISEIKLHSTPFPPPCQSFLQKKNKKTGKKKEGRTSLEIPTPTHPPLSPKIPVHHRGNRNVLPSPSPPTLCLLSMQEQMV